MSPRPTPARLAVLALAGLLLLALSSTALAAPARPAPALAAARTLSAITAPGGRLSGGPVVAGDRIVFAADFDVEGRTELYSQPLAGGSPARLAAGLPPGQVETFQVAGAQAVFTHRADGDRKLRLYRAPLAGGAAALIFGDYPDAAGDAPGGTGLTFSVSADAARVVFRTDVVKASAFELFSAPLAGGAPVKLNAPLPASPPGSFALGVRDFKLSADGALVVYELPRNLGGSDYSLYAVPAAGGASTLLAAEVSPYAGLGFAISPSGARVVFLAPVPGQPALTITSVGADGLGTTPLATVSSSRPGFAITPDSARVVFDATPPAQFTQFAELRSVPIGGGASALIADSVGNFTYPLPFVLSASGDQVYFNGASALLRAPVAGGAAPTTVLGTGTANLGTLKFTPDGARALFLAPGAPQLYSHDVASGATVRLDDPALSAGGILDLRLAGGRALYVAGAAAQGPFDLYSVSVAGGPSVKVSGTLAPGENAVEAVAAAGQQAVFAPGFRDFRFPPPGFSIVRRILAAPVDGSAAPTPLTATRARGGDVGAFAVSVADGRALYLADQEVAGMVNLYSVPLAGGAPVQLNGALAQASGAFGLAVGVESFALSPAGGRAAYVARQAGDAVAELYGVPVAGGAAVSLSGDLQAPQRVRDVAFTPDGGQVLFLVDPQNLQGADLFRAPAAGGAPVKIAGGVTEYQITADGQRAVYRVATGSPVGELRSVPVAGGDPVTLGPINGAFALSPDGARVIYTAPSQLFGPGALVSQPAAGGAAVTLRESGAQDVAITPDGAGVVYVFGDTDEGAALPRSNLVYQPIGGGEARVLLRATAAQISYVLAPAGGRVAAITQSSGGGPAFYSLSTVRTSGGPVDTLAAPGQARVAAPRFSADGAELLFTAGADLYRAPAGGPAAKLAEGVAAGSYAFDEAGRAVFIAGRDLFVGGAAGAAPARLNQPAPADQRVNSFVVAGDTVVYRAGSDFVSVPGLLERDVQELFAADLPSPDPKPFKAYLPLAKR